MTTDLLRPLAVAVLSAAAPVLALAQEYPSYGRDSPASGAASDGGGTWIWILVLFAAVAIAWGVYVARRGRRARSGAPTPPR
jgi:hypothetical protein